MEECITIKLELNIPIEKAKEYLAEKISSEDFLKTCDFDYRDLVDEFFRLGIDTRIKEEEEK